MTTPLCFAPGPLMSFPAGFQMDLRAVKVSAPGLIVDGTNNVVELSPSEVVTAANISQVVRGSMVWTEAALQTETLFAGFSRGEVRIDSVPAGTIFESTVELRGTVWKLEATTPKATPPNESAPKKKRIWSASFSGEGISARAE